MSAAAIRAFGIVTLLFDFLILLVFNTRRFAEDPLTLRAKFAMGLYLFFVALVGIGLLLLRKWAAIVFALVLVVVPTWMTIDSIGEAPSGFYFIMLAVGVVLVMPIVVIVRSWNLLSWRGKWLL